MTNVVRVGVVKVLVSVKDVMVVACPRMSSPTDYSGPDGRGLVLV